MSFVPLPAIDPAAASETSARMCTLFGIPSLRAHQVSAGQNILLGLDTVLDAPTGSGKTYAAYYPLFHYWQPGDTLEDHQKIILFIGPLVGLMKAQAEELNSLGIPAVAITSDHPNVAEAMKDLGSGHFRVGFVGPEMAKRPDFNTTVISSSTFRRNLISLVVDEAHCISEWGSDTFRPDYSTIVGQLRGRLPSGLPVLLASATMPIDVLRDIQSKVGLTNECRYIAISNAKLNIAISVRIMQHAEDSYADLMTLIVPDATSADDIPQTLLYVKDRTSAEKIQDFFRTNDPTPSKSENTEFYHRFIDQKRKDIIQKAIVDGRLRIIPTTEALGLGLNYPHVVRVVIWDVPPSMCSLTQKIGRCRGLIGEAIVYITPAFYAKHRKKFEEVEAEEDMEDVLEAEEEEHASGSDGQVSEHEEGGEKDDVVRQLPPPSVPSGKKGKTLKKLSPLEARDQKYLIYFLVTTQCRRIPWNLFFGNDTKVDISPPVPPGTRCCDNCHPEAFPVDTVILEGDHKLKTGRLAKSSEEVFDAVYDALIQWRRETVEREYGNQIFITGNAILHKDVLITLAERAPLLDTVESISDYVYWGLAAKYGDAVFQVIRDVLHRFPEAVAVTRTRRVQEREAAAKLRAEFADTRSKLQAVFRRCLDEILEAKKVNDDDGVEYTLSAPFMRVPNSRKWPDYREKIAEPISILNIQANTKRNQYKTLMEYYTDWKLLFDNCRLYNAEGSFIYDSANILEGILVRQLRARTRYSGLPGADELPDYD